MNAEVTDDKLGCAKGFLTARLLEAFLHQLETDTKIHKANFEERRESNLERNRRSDKTKRSTEEQGHYQLWGAGGKLTLAAVLSYVGRDPSALVGIADSCVAFATPYAQGKNVEMQTQLDIIKGKCQELTQKELSKEDTSKQTKELISLLAELEKQMLQQYN